MKDYLESLRRAANRAYTTLMSLRGVVYEGELTLLTSAYIHGNRGFLYFPDRREGYVIPTLIITQSASRFSRTAVAVKWKDVVQRTSKKWLKDMKPRSLIKTVLEQVPGARENDGVLVYHVWKVTGAVEEFTDSEGLPELDLVGTRIRAHIKFNPELAYSVESITRLRRFEDEDSPVDNETRERRKKAAELFRKSIKRILG